MKRAAALAANVLLALASLGVTLGALELVARLTAEPAGPPVPALYTEHDPLLGWRHRRGARAQFPQGSYAINSRGLRDEERGYAAPPGTERVLVLGDSFAEGFSVRFEDSVSRVLAQELSGGGCSVDVVNGGVAGYSTDQEYLFYREEASRYGARTVLLFFFYNDILANDMTMGRAPKPRLSCDEEVLRLLNDPVPAPADPQAGHLRRRPAYARNSAALDWLRTRVSARPGVYNALARVGLWKPLVPTPLPDELKVFNRDVHLAERHAWSCTTRLLQALNDEVKARGARLLVVYVPSKMEVSGRDWGQTLLQYRIKEEQLDRGKVARDLAQAAASVGFPVLDLTKPLAAADSAVLGGPYYSHGGHWNALGHRVAGQALGRFLRERGWLAPCGARAAPVR